MLERVSGYYSEDFSRDDALVPVLRTSQTVQELSSALASSPSRCCFVVEAKGDAFVEVLTQGDFLRRCNALSGIEDAHIETLVKRESENFFALNTSIAFSLLESHSLTAVPIVSVDRRLIGFAASVPQSSPGRPVGSDSRVRYCLLISGGLGTRLGSLTARTPKPLLRLGDKTVLEHVMSSLAQLKIANFYLLTGHMSEQFEEFALDTDRKICICRESERLDTGGPLINWFHNNRDEIREAVSDFGELTLVLSNADLLYDLEHHLIQKIEQQDRLITMMASPHSIDLKYGVVELDQQGCLLEIQEKPSFEYLINTGIYIIKLNSNLVDILGTFKIKPISMPVLLQEISAALDQSINVEVMSGNYIDIGTLGDFNKVENFFGSK